MIAVERRRKRWQHTNCRIGVTVGPIPALVDERAVATGTSEAGRALRTELRRQVATAGLGQRLANSWRDKHYPNRKLDAASLVYTKAPQIIGAFDEGVVIRSGHGRFLAIPIENAPRKGTDGRRISPSNFPEHRFGSLRFVPRRSGPSLLVDGLRASYSRQTGELRGFRRASDRARRSRCLPEVDRSAPAQWQAGSTDVVGHQLRSRRQRDLKI